MSSPHHSEDRPTPFADFFKDVPIQSLEDREAKLLERFQAQQRGDAERTYSEGRLSSNDDGDLAYRVCTHKGTVVIDFGKPVRSLALEPAHVRELAALLTRHAEAIEPSREARKESHGQYAREDPYAGPDTGQDDS